MAVLAEPVFGRRDPDARGYFGAYGGRFVPETLVAAGGGARARLLRGARPTAAFVDEFVAAAAPLRRPADAALRGGAAVRGRRLPRLPQARGPGPHRRAQDQQRASARRCWRSGWARRRVVAETGAGQHGVASATACALLGLECVVYMGTEDMARQALNVVRMRLLGADRGRRRRRQPHAEGRHQRGDARLGRRRPHDTHYLLGSALGPHPYPLMVREFQSIIGQEARQQILAQAGRLPDAVLACVGGGSNAIGLFDAFIDDAGGPPDRRRSRRRRASRRAGMRRASPAAAPACCRAPGPTCCRTPPATSS